jgi:hypothetical protein
MCHTVFARLDAAPTRSASVRTGVQDVSSWPLLILS